jgi:hypothetical protein
MAHTATDTGRARVRARGQSLPCSVTAPLRPVVRASSRAVGRLSGAAIGYAVVFVILGGYFTWICLEMARHALGGGPLLGAVFGGELPSLHGRDLPISRA